MVEMKFVLKPWWKRLPAALEILIFGTTVIKGQISELAEDGVRL